MKFQSEAEWRWKTADRRLIRDFLSIRGFQMARCRRQVTNRLASQAVRGRMPVT